HPSAAIPGPSNKSVDGSGTAGTAGTAVKLKFPDPSMRPELKLPKLNPVKEVLTPLKSAIARFKTNGPLRNPPTGLKRTCTSKSPLARPGNACASPATKPDDWATRISSPVPQIFTVPPTVPTGAAL